MPSKDDWITTYRTFSDTKLEKEIEKLESLRDNFMSSQSTGSKSFSLDRDSINTQYNAAVMVKAERGRRTGTNGNQYGTTDFSKSNVS